MNAKLAILVATAIYSSAALAGNAVVCHGLMQGDGQIASVNLSLREITDDPHAAFVTFTAAEDIAQVASIKVDAKDRSVSTFTMETSEQGKVELKIKEFPLRAGVKSSFFAVVDLAQQKRDQKKFTAHGLMDCERTTSVSSN